MVMDGLLQKKTVQDYLYITGDPDYFGGDEYRFAKDYERTRAFCPECRKMVPAMESYAAGFECPHCGKRVPAGMQQRFLYQSTRHVHQGLNFDLKELYAFADGDVLSITALAADVYPNIRAGVLGVKKFWVRLALNGRTGQSYVFRPVIRGKSVKAPESGERNMPVIQGAIHGAFNRLYQNVFANEEFQAFVYSAYEKWEHRSPMFENDLKITPIPARYRGDWQDSDPMFMDTMVYAGWGHPGYVTLLTMANRYRNLTMQELEWFYKNGMGKDDRLRKKACHDMARLNRLKGNKDKKGIVRFFTGSCRNVPLDDKKFFEDINYAFAYSLIKILSDGDEEIFSRYREDEKALRFLSCAAAEYRWFFKKSYYDSFKFWKYKELETSYLALHRPNMCYWEPWSIRTMNRLHKELTEKGAERTLDMVRNIWEASFYRFANAQKRYGSWYSDFIMSSHNAAAVTKDEDECGLIFAL